MPKPTLIVITGPTACGKTALSLALGQILKAPIINADARQFYRGMDIGTAKVSPEEQALVPHHFLDFLEVWEDFSAGSYENQALECLEQLFQNSNYVLAVGGSVFYLRALLRGLDQFPAIVPEIKTALQEQYQSQGIESLQKELKQLDPDYYAQVDLQNPHRLIRALSVCLSSGQRFSSFHRQEAQSRPWQSLSLAPDWPRPALYERINQRAEIMLNQGLEAEVRRLWPHKNCNAMQTVGYREWDKYFEGEQNLSQTLNLIQQHSRNYAKRQLTLLRKEPQLHWLSPQMEQALEQSLEQIKKLEKNHTPPDPTA